MRLVTGVIAEKPNQPTAARVRSDVDVTTCCYQCLLLPILALVTNTLQRSGNKNAEASTGRKLNRFGKAATTQPSTTVIGGSASTGAKFGAFCVHTHAHMQITATRVRNILLAYTQKHAGLG